MFSVDSFKVNSVFQLSVFIVFDVVKGGEIAHVGVNVARVFAEFEHFLNTVFHLAAHKLSDVHREREDSEIDKRNVAVRLEFKKHE